MSLVNYEKEKFSVFHSKWSKLLNLLDKDKNETDDICVELLKRINSSLDSLIIEIDDLKNYMKSNTNKNNKYYKQKVLEYKERQNKITELIPYLISNYTL